MNIIQLLKQEEVLNGHYIFTSNGGEKWIPGWLEICEVNDNELEEKYNQMVEDIKELKKQYGNEIIKLEGIYYRWEVELYKKWEVAKVRNNTLIVLADKKVINKKHKEQFIPFTFYLLNKMLNIYKEKLSYAKEQEAIEFLGVEEYERQKKEKYEKARKEIKKVLNDKGLNDFEKELYEEAERLEKETENENKTHDEFISKRELKEGEIDVNSLPL